MLAKYLAVVFLLPSLFTYARKFELLYVYVQVEQMCMDRRNDGVAGGISVRFVMMLKV